VEIKLGLSFYGIKRAQVVYEENAKQDIST
jgi:hypothetical protein